MRKNTQSKIHWKFINKHKNDVLKYLKKYLKTYWKLSLEFRELRITNKINVRKREREKKREWEMRKFSRRVLLDKHS